jgi:hypothetical protein
MFEIRVFKSSKWVDLIIDIRHHLYDSEGDEEYKFEESDNKEADSIGSRNTLFVADAMDKELEDAIEFEWVNDIQNLVVGKDWGATVRAHCEALSLLREAVLGRTQGHKIRMPVSDKNQDWLGKLNNIIGVQGSLGAAMGFALASSSTTRENILKLSSDMDALGDEISKYAQATRVSKEFLLNIVMRVQESGQQGSCQAIT